MSPDSPFVRSSCSSFRPFFDVIVLVTEASHQVLETVVMEIVVSLLIGEEVEVVLPPTHQQQHVHRLELAVVPS